MLELLINQPIFIGFKADSGLRRHFESASDSYEECVSGEDLTFLRSCRVGKDIYVGKLIYESLTTDRVDDICRDILGIIRRLGPTVRLPTKLRILACGTMETNRLPAVVRHHPPQAPVPRAPVR